MAHFVGRTRMFGFKNVAVGNTQLLTYLFFALLAIVSPGCDSTQVTSGTATTPIDPLVPIGPVDDESVAVLSSFRNGSLDGWTVSRSSLTSNPASGICGTIFGDPGFLCVAPAGEGLTSYFSAPVDFRGDLSAFIALRFRIQTKGGSYYSTGYGSIGDVVISSGSGTATYFFGSDDRPDDSWKEFSLSFIEPAGWLIDGASSLDDLLADVSGIQIRAEYGLGVDYTGLDDVALLLR